MRRLFSQRNSKPPQQSLQSTQRNKSKHSIRRRGHSLMYRTEFSLEKVRKNSFQQCKVSKKNEEVTTTNDYLLRNKKNEKNRKKRTLRSGSFLKLRKDPTTKMKTEQFHDQYVNSNSKTELMFRRPSGRPSKKLFPKKIHSMKSINTTDTKKQTYSGSSSSLYASNYQMQNILEIVTNQAGNPNTNSSNHKKPQVVNKKNEDYQIYKPNRHKTSQISSLSSQFNHLTSQRKQKNKGLNPSQISDMHNHKKVSRLSIESKKCSILQKNSIGDKISLHLQILGELAEYSKSMIEMYENLEEWEEMIFLVYKKYYLQRLKVLDALKNHVPYNPFNLSTCTVSKEELKSFRKKLECQKIINEVQTQNKTMVIQSLRNFYNLIITKSGEYINLQEIDNFSWFIYNQMKTQIVLLNEMLSESDSKIQVEKRLRQIFRTAFLISELNGNLLMSYEESLDQDSFGSYIVKAQNLFKKLLYF